MEKNSTEKETQEKTPTGDEETPENKDPQQEEQEEKDTKEEEEVKPSERQTRYVPHEALHAEREKNKALKAEKEQLESRLQEMSDKKEEKKDISKEVDELAEEFGVEKKFVDKLVNIISDQSKLPQDVMEKVSKIDTIADQRLQDELFEKDFKKLIQKHPEASSHKDRIKELAFSDSFSKTPLEVIYLGHPNEFKPDKGSAETKEGGEISTGDMSFEEIMNLPDNQRTKAIAEMDDKRYDKFSDWLSKTQGNTRIIRR